MPAVVIILLFAFSVLLLLAYVIYCCFHNISQSDIVAVVTQVLSEGGMYLYLTILRCNVFP